MAAVRSHGQDSQVETAMRTTLLTRHALTTIRRITERELRTRVAGTVLGLFHYVLTPLFFLGVYSVVFSSVFATRWPGAADGFGRFALNLYAGLIPFHFVSEVLNRSSGLVLENPSYVKKVVFPLEILGPAAMGTALACGLVSYVIFLAGYLLMQGVPPVASLSLLLLWPPLLLGVAGLSWILSALGVFLRDLAPVVTTLMPALMFVTPVFYPLQMVPASIRPILHGNPLTYFIEAMRAALFQGLWPDAPGLFLAWCGGAALASLGLWVFLRLKPAFADVI